MPELSPEFLALQAAVAGRYSLVHELGRGGMGIVFLAREVALDRLVAIKLLPPSLARDPASRERFLREARTAAGLAHPHIVPIHAVEAHDALVFFVMEYVAGESLGARLRRLGTLRHEELARIGQEVAWALGHAHARGVIHRDIKPDNILLGEDGDRTVVTDFGIAHHGPSHDSAAGHGTLHFMAPEQGLGLPVDGRADLYALGVTLYQAATGRRPFEGLDGAAVLVAQSEQEPPPVQQLAPTLPGGLAAAIDRAIRSEAASRFPDADAMAQALQQVRAVAPNLPMPLRRFARQALEHGRQVAPLLGVMGAGVLGAFAIEAFFDSFFGIESVIFAFVAALAGIGALGMLVRHLVQLREVAALGYGRASVLRAVAQRDREEEHESEPLGGPRWSRSRPVVIAAGAVATVMGLAVTTGDFGPLNLVGYVVALLTPAIVVARVARLRGRAGSWWARALRSRVGAGLWTVATLGLRRTAPRAVAGEPTALAVGASLQELHAALPDAERRQLAEVPALIARLEAAALDRANPASREAMVALETLRLDLLRLGAGQLTSDGITEDLRRLADLGRYVDAREDL